MFDLRFNTKFAVVLITLFAIFSGCASVDDVVGPSGEVNKLVKCSSIELCYSKARETCGGNYKIIHSSTSTSGAPGVGVSSEESILIKCEK